MADDTRVSLKKYTELLVKSARLEARITASQNRQAVKLARAELQHRLEAMNHIKEQQNALAAQMATKDTVGGIAKELQELKANRYQAVINILIGAGLAWVALQLGR